MTRRFQTSYHRQKAPGDGYAGEQSHSLLSYGGSGTGTLIFNKAQPMGTEKSTIVLSGQNTMTGHTAARAVEREPCCPASNSISAIAKP